MTTQTIAVTVNGVRYERSVEPRLLLSDFLRHELSLTGTHVGCEHGICGACTVLLDGLATRSCLCLAMQADGASVETDESLGRIDALHSQALQSRPPRNSGPSASRSLPPTQPGQGA